MIWTSATSSGSLKRIRSNSPGLALFTVAIASWVGATSPPYSIFQVRKYGFRCRVAVL